MVESVGLCEKKDIESLINDLQSETRMIISLIRTLEK
ncbi:hypothetical protein L2E69_02410 [Planktothrix agardhii 1806]|nr:hypothetical protein [Planktothrix agardhii 1807]MCF3569454.1 hypothetical protein [Planktothrix agardhii 1805]MCF3578579.1 hypothetical protein [Planktothrix agardhii 1812]MCF3584258.1 hypothetical protein [Planktothrix agardhii 1803]MCF3591336.1 hypothetical protein [Planktothrix agardhii 1029]MCF3600108.1 hypothetical protein [Planktothrix agardhii 1032]MCF3604393.1 hypothetical protein [Planktothrix agardhii 1804]MCF3614801.1 hypothetical protein [Planktothrix agardhii 1806]MCF361919